MSSSGNGKKRTDSRADQVELRRTGDLQGVGQVDKRNLKTYVGVLFTRKRRLKSNEVEVKK